MTTIADIREVHAGCRGSGKGQYRLGHRNVALLLDEIERLQKRVADQALVISGKTFVTPEPTTTLNGYALSPGDSYALGYNDGGAGYASRESLVRAAHETNAPLVCETCDGHGRVINGSVHASGPSRTCPICGGTGRQP